LHIDTKHIKPNRGLYSAYVMDGDDHSVRSQHVQPCNTFKMAIPSGFLHPPIIPPHWHQIYYKWMFDYAQFISRNPFTSKQQVLWVKFNISYNSFFLSATETVIWNWTTHIIQVTVIDTQTMEYQQIILETLHIHLHPKLVCYF
jgi:hypothetical protein